MIGDGMDGTMQSRLFDEWKNHVRSGYMTALLMHKCRTNYWTNGGHYIAIVNYDAATDRFMVYDPASDVRTGWHGFGDFAGDICSLYTSGIRWAAEEKRYKYEPIQVEFGVHGADVSILEAILYARGIYDGKLFDGSCGDRLKNAITTYQRRRCAQGANLRIDGKCGPQTWGDLLGTGDGYIMLEDIDGGSVGLSVLLAQEIMSAYGYYLGTLDQKFGNGCIVATTLLKQKLGVDISNSTWTRDFWKKVLK